MAENNNSNGTTKKTTKGIGFFSFLFLDIFVSILVAFLFGLPFGLAFALLLALYVIARLKEYRQTDTIGRILMFSLVAIVAAFFLEAQFPRTAKSLPWLQKRADFYVAKETDSTGLTTAMTWEYYKEKHSQEMLTEYRKRLNSNDPEGAARVEVEFKEKWNKTKWEEKLSPEEVEINPSAKPIHSSETIKLHKKEQWFPTHRFKAGDKYTLVVKYNPVKHIQGNGSTETIGVGSHSRTMITDGAPAFEGLALSEISVIY